MTIDTLLIQISNAGLAINNLFECTSHEATKDASRWTCYLRATHASPFSGCYHGGKGCGSTALKAISKAYSNALSTPQPYHPELGKPTTPSNLPALDSLLAHLLPAKPKINPALIRRFKLKELA